MSQHSPNTPQTPLPGSGILRWFEIVPYSARLPHPPQPWLHGGSAQFALDCVPGSRRSPISSGLTAYVRPAPQSKEAGRIGDSQGAAGTCQENRSARDDAQQNSGFFRRPNNPDDHRSSCPREMRDRGIRDAISVRSVQIWAPFLPQSLAAVLPYPTMGIGGFQLVSFNESLHVYQLFSGPEETQSQSSSVRLKVGLNV
jgi:hypothetical protein